MHPSRATILMVAGLASADPRTVARVLREGPGILRHTALRERIERALGDLGLDPPRGGADRADDDNGGSAPGPGEGKR